jgi:hypothetical protein
MLAVSWRNHSLCCSPALGEKRNDALLAALLVLISLFALAARSPCKAFALWGESFARRCSRKIKK